MSISLPVCPIGCNVAPPRVQFDNCSPEVHEGGIEYLYIGTRGEVFADWTQQAEWTSRIDNTNTAAADIRQFRVIGEMPRPESNIKDISGGRKHVGAKSFTLELEVDETNDVNREWVRNNECNGNFAVWFETSNQSGSPGLLFGDNDGVQAHIVGDYMIPREESDLHKIMITVTWKSKYTPKSIVSPILHD